MEKGSRDANFAGSRRGDGSRLLVVGASNCFAPPVCPLGEAGGLHEWYCAEERCYLRAVSPGTSPCREPARRPESVPPVQAGVAHGAEVGHSLRAVQCTLGGHSDLDRLSVGAGTSPAPDSFDLHPADAGHQPRQRVRLLRGGICLSGRVRPVSYVDARRGADAFEPPRVASPPLFRELRDVAVAQPRW